MCEVRESAPCERDYCAAVNNETDLSAFAGAGHVPARRSDSAPKPALQSGETVTDLRPPYGDGGVPPPLRAR